jgi:hypothetical protein
MANLYYKIPRLEAKMASERVPILDDPMLQTLIIALIFVLLGLTAHATTLILRAYWNHFTQVIFFNSKF